MDWAGNPYTGYSVSRYIFMVNGAPVLWSSKPQSVTALSSMEAEYVALACGVQQAIWMNSWLSEVELRGNGAMKLLCDNLGVISLTETMQVHAISKAINVCYHFIWDEVNAGKVEIYPVATQDNIADLMTKSLPKEQHCRFVQAFGLDWWYCCQGEC